MADDFDQKLRQIAQMFGMGGGQASSPSPNEESSAESQSVTAPQNTSGPFGGFNPGSSYTPPGSFDLQALSKARDILDSFNNVSDHRITLLNSIHPFLSPLRQQRCASCIQILKIISVVGAFSKGRNPPTA